LPQYDQHKGITKMAKDDREEFYITVGNFLKAVQDNSKLFTHNDFATLYLEAKQSAPGGELMPRFKQIYDRWYSAAIITRRINKGKRWNSTPSIESQGLLPFEEEINYIESNGDSDILEAWWASADGIAKTAEMEQIKANQGGGRKRRRKKTKRRRKKKRKSRRRRKTRRRRKKRTRRKK
jgi:hypothetical protein